MKKRFSLLCLSLLISPFMIYGMEEEGDDSGLNSPYQYHLTHLTRYAVEQGWVKKHTPLEKQLRTNEEKMSRTEEYDGLVQCVLLERNDTVELEEGFINMGKESLHRQILMIATALSEEQIKMLLYYSNVKEIIDEAQRKLKSL